MKKFKSLLGLSCLLATLNLTAGYDCSPADIATDNCKHLVKLNSSAALGKCLPPGIPKDIPGLFARNNIVPSSGFLPKKRGFATNLVPFKNQTDPRIIALARVVYAMENIGQENPNNKKYGNRKTKRKSKMMALKDGDEISVIFSNSQSTATNSRRYGNQIQIKGGSQNMKGTQHTSSCNGEDNYGLLAHEIGHYISGNNNQEIMIKYQRFMKGHRCKLSSYTTKNLNEEFSELIAAYITLPSEFAKEGASCAKGFEFMTDLFGEPDMKMTCEARRNSYKVETNKGFIQERMQRIRRHQQGTTI